MSVLSFASHDRATRSFMEYCYSSVERAKTAEVPWILRLEQVKCLGFKAYIMITSTFNKEHGTIFEHQRLKEVKGRK